MGATSVAIGVDADATAGSGAGARTGSRGSATAESTAGEATQPALVITVTRIADESGRWRCEDIESTYRSVRTTSQFAAALAFALVACGPSGTDPAPSAQPSVSVAPVPRPASVEATILADDLPRLHDDLKTRHGLGAYLLGKSWAGTVVSLVGLPIATAEHVALEGTIRGVMTRGEKGPGYAFAIPLHNPGALLAVATAGDASPFRRRAEGGWDHLVPVRNDGATIARALISNHLVVASSAEVLADVGAFIAQTSPSGFPGTGEAKPTGATAASVRGTVRSAALKPWVTSAADRVGASVPFDLAMLSAARLSDEIPFRVTVGPTTLDAVLELGPLQDGAAAPLEPGPFARLLELPAETELGLMLYQPESARAAAARAGSSWLGAGLLAGAATQLTPAFEEVAHARGPGLALGYRRGGTGRMMFGVSDLADEARAKKGLHALIKGLEDKSVTAALASRGFTVSASDTVLERIGDVTRVRVSRGDETTASIVLRIQKGRLVFASGADAPAGLAAMSGEGPRLGALAEVAPIGAAIGESVLAAAILDTTVLASEPARAPAPRGFAAAALVPTDRRVELRLVIGAGALAPVSF